MYGFQVYRDNGNVISSDIIFFGMTENIVIVPAWTKRTIMPFNNNGRVLYAVGAVIDSPTAFNTELLGDGGFHVNNLSNYPVEIIIMRY